MGYDEGWMHASTKRVYQYVFMDGKTQDINAKLTVVMGCYPSLFPSSSSSPAATQPLPFLPTTTSFYYYYGTITLLLASVQQCVVR